MPPKRRNHPLETANPSLLTCDLGDIVWGASTHIITWRQSWPVPGGNICVDVDVEGSPSIFLSGIRRWPSPVEGSVHKLTLFALLTK